MRGMKFDVRDYTNEEFRALQQSLLDMGFVWAGGATTPVNKEGYDNFLYANDDGKICRGESEFHFTEYDKHLEVVECLIVTSVKVIIPEPVELIDIDGVRYNKNDVLEALAAHQIQAFLK